jgi:hypothetical protein
MSTRRETDFIIFSVGCSFPVLPNANTDQSKGQTELNINNIEFLALVNTAPVTVVNLTSGSQGRSVKFLGDGQTTFANNTVIKTNTGANKLLAVDKVYVFTLYNNLWIENE